MLHFVTYTCSVRASRHDATRESHLVWWLGTYAAKERPAAFKLGCHGLRVGNRNRDEQFSLKLRGSEDSSTQRCGKQHHDVEEPLAAALFKLNLTRNPGPGVKGYTSLPQ
jgi:hypothetical protein